jgi:hypothetical protein
MRHSSQDQYVPENRTSETKGFNQQELNDPIRDLSLSEDKAVFASGMNERNLSSQSDVRICHYQTRNNVF